MQIFNGRFLEAVELAGAPRNACASRWIDVLLGSSCPAPHTPSPLGARTFPPGESSVSRSDRTAGREHARPCGEAYPAKTHDSSPGRICRQSVVCSTTVRFPSAFPAKDVLDRAPLWERTRCGSGTGARQRVEMQHAAQHGSRTAGITHGRALRAPSSNSVAP